ncbi:hypothetical protein [Piscinibacter gummiphilus]|uniref:hypothetical protein n=1 Tax=Piscinibacter gummiphilus TaxID=946333 RepID=UPI001F1E39C8|nr:hypothetical protein [Piscinibacter gummiphilus]GLS96435.1 hypothetical protein GCM10007918_37270 [Piscinibacter gummiphilus]
MPTFHTRVAAALLVSFAGVAQAQPASPLVRQLNNGNWLEQKEAENLRDELYY